MSKLTVITGRRGKGKTSLAYFLASAGGRGVAVFDTTHAFEIGAIVHSRAELDLALDREDSPIVFQPVMGIEEKDFIENRFAEFIEALKHFREISIVIDESSYLQSPQWISAMLDDEIRCGRRREHDVYLTQHRMQDCNGILLSLVTHFRFFQTKHPRDLERIAECTSEAIAGAVSKLKDFEFLAYDVEKETSFVNQAPEFWRVSLSLKPEFHPAANAMSDQVAQ